MGASATIRALGCALTCASLVGESRAQQPGERGGPGLALVAGKALVASWDGEQVIDHAVLLAKDGRIEACGARGAVEIPAGYERVDLGSAWIMPGMIDLHCHIAGSSGDINDMVLQTNEGLRVAPTVTPGNANLRRVVSAGVTTVLYIPGSGTNVGGQGILLKTGLERFEEMRVRDPGSLKIAQGDNPTRFAYGMGRSLMNYHIRTTVRRGVAYAREHAQPGARKPPINPQFETFRALASHDAQISTHTQMYQLVLTTITMLKGEFGLDVFIDHGEWGGYQASEMAERLGVAAVVGPREIDTSEGRHYTDGAIVGCAGEYQKRGLSRIGFNTDAPVVPGEELPLQAAVATRYGFDGSQMQAVRGLTIVPAKVMGIDARVGSLERGKDADVVVITGDPADPRSYVERVWIEGREVYAAEEGRRRW